MNSGGGTVHKVWWRSRIPWLPSWTLQSGRVCTGAMGAKPSPLSSRAVGGVVNVCGRGGGLESSNSSAEIYSGWRDGQGFSLMISIPLTIMVAFYVPRVCSLKLTLFLTKCIFSTYLYSLDRDLRAISNNHFTACRKLCHAFFLPRQLGLSLLNLSSLKFSRHGQSTAGAFVRV